MDLGAVGRCDQAAYFVGGAVDLGGALGGGAVEQVDEAPGDLLGVGFKGRLRKDREQVRPDGVKDLLHSLVDRQVGRGGGRCGLDRKVAELELGELCGKAGVHRNVSRESRRLLRRQGPRTRPCRLTRTAPSRGKPPAKAGAGRPA